MANTAGRRPVLVRLMVLSVAGSVCAGVALHTDTGDDGATQVVLYATANVLFGVCDLPAQSIMRAIVSQLYVEDPSRLKAAFAAMMCSIVGSSLAAFFAGRFVPKMLQVAMLISLALATIACLYKLPTSVMVDAAAPVLVPNESKRCGAGKRKEGGGGEVAVWPEGAVT